MSGRTRLSVIIAAVLAVVHPVAAQDTKSAETKAAEIVDAAMKPCFTNVGPNATRQARDMLLIKARAIAAGRQLTPTEQTRAEGMSVATEDEAAFEGLGCVADGDSPLAEWTAEVKWAGVIPPDAIDPDQEAKRIATICTWGTGASVRDRYRTMLTRYLRWMFVQRLEKRELDKAEQTKLLAARKALGVIPEKINKQLIDCVIETTKGTPVELHRAPVKPAKSSAQKKK